METVCGKEEGVGDYTDTLDMFSEIQEKASPQEKTQWVEYGAFRQEFTDKGGKVLCRGTPGINTWLLMPLERTRKHTPHSLDDFKAELLHRTTQLKFAERLPFAAWWSTLGKTRIIFLNMWN
ncbi:hypothetical protein AAFF_G00306750 [Aldrovandia affinis]|uniref:Uncharacterized protein n=1 Tax=Aldrovandia affinis TaxID=143900 RepID=A0AAD7R8M7_9TELE|nr:hypothetical protein AAFF_G00306750 [Aldrovandia affinis]